MKKHIYVLALLCGISISYPIFTNKEEETRKRIIQLIERQIKLKRNAATALDHILRRAPKGNTMGSYWSSVFLQIYPDLQKVYEEYPSAFCSRLEKAITTQ